MSSTKKKAKLADFRPQEQNANQHTERGLWMLDKSIGEDGWIGAITTAADGEVFDGSARIETVYNRLGEEVEPIVVDIDGNRPVIVRRTDIPTAQDPRAKKLAIAANRVAQVDLKWDANVLAELQEEIDLSDLFSEAELDKFATELELSVEDDNEPEKQESEVIGDKYPLAIVLSWSEFQEWKAWKDAAGKSKDKDAFLELLRQ